MYSLTVKTDRKNAIVQFRNGQMYNVLLVIATESSLLHYCSMDDFLKVNETKIKVVSSYPSTLKFDVPVEKKHISD